METLDADEKVLYNLFGNADGSIRVTSDSAEFDLAAYMGRKAGGQQCQKVKLGPRSNTFRLF